MTDLPYIASRLFGTPLLIARPKLDVILGVLGPRMAGNALEPPNLGAVPSRQTAITPDGIAVIPVTGTLVSRSGYLAAASGLMSYSDIGDAIEAAAANALVRGIMLDIDSPGGEVGGLFDLVENIAAIRQESGKPIWAVANEAALSAAYAIACAADVLYIAQTGEVGSVGVVAVHVDESNADRMAGLAWTFVHAGERKVDGNQHEPLSPRARSDIQADVDRLYDRFVALVASNRNLSPQIVRAAEAAVYRGELAVKAGLADRVGAFRQALAELSVTLTPSWSPEPSGKPVPRGRAAPSINSRKETSMQNTDHITEAPASTTPEAAGEPLPEAATVHPTPALVAGPDPAEIEQRLRGEYAELAAVAAQAGCLGIKVDAAEAMAKGLRPDAIRRSVLDELAARSDAADIVAAAPVGPRPTAESPIVKRAREAASRA